MSASDALDFAALINRVWVLMDPAARQRLLDRLEAHVMTLQGMDNFVSVISGLSVNRAPGLLQCAIIATGIARLKYSNPEFYTEIEKIISEECDQKKAPGGAPSSVAKLNPQTLPQARLFTSTTTRRAVGHGR